MPRDTGCQVLRHCRVSARRCPPLPHGVLLDNVRPSRTSCCRLTGFEMAGRWGPAASTLSRSIAPPTGLEMWSTLPGASPFGSRWPSSRSGTSIADRADGDQASRSRSTQRSHGRGRQQVGSSDIAMINVWRQHACKVVDCPARPLRGRRSHDFCSPSVFASSHLRCDGRMKSPQRDRKIEWANGPRRGVAGRHRDRCCRALENGACS